MKMRWKKRAETAQPTESARPAGRVMPDPTAPNPHHPRLAPQWRAGQKRRTPSVPRLHPAEAELQLRVEHERRRAEEQAERARIAAELKAERARHEAASEAVWDEFLSKSLWLDAPENGHRNVDIRDRKF